MAFLPGKACPESYLFPLPINLAVIGGWEPSFGLKVFIISFIVANGVTIAQNIYIWSVSTKL